MITNNYCHFGNWKFVITDKQHYLALVIDARTHGSTTVVGLMVKWQNILLRFNRVMNSVELPSKGGIACVAR